MVNFRGSIIIDCVLDAPCRKGTNVRYCMLLKALVNSIIHDGTHNCNKCMIKSENKSRRAGLWYLILRLRSQPFFFCTRICKYKGYFSVSTRTRFRMPTSSNTYSTIIPLPTLSTHRFLPLYCILSVISYILCFTTCLVLPSYSYFTSSVAAGFDSCTQKSI